jgi:hypothetical protein
MTNSECSSDGGAFCLGLTATDDVCVQKCADSSDAGQSTCRNGYTCEQYLIGLADGGNQPSVDGFCVPPTAPIPTTIGGPCAVTADCSVPTGAIADCEPATQTDGGPSGFTDGYCTRYDCADDSECSQDGGAQCFTIGANTTACFSMCPTANVGQSTCRAGYVCSSFGIADGGQSSNGVCDPACNAVGAGACTAPKTCNAMGYCR